jgi:hypothetical protein
LLGVGEGGLTASLNREMLAVHQGVVGKSVWMVEDRKRVLAGVSHRHFFLKVKLILSPTGFDVRAIQCCQSALVRPRITSRSPWLGR